MKQLFKRKLPSIVGLDIGTRQIKAVLLEQSEAGYTLQSFACEPISKIAFAEREIKDYEAVSMALKKVKNALKVKDKSVALAVSGASVINKMVYMDPEQNDFEMESQIEIEADSLIPYPLEEVYLDFEEMGPSKTHEGKVNVLLTAAHKDLVDSRITLAREVQFEPKVVDIEGYALGNAIKYFYANQDSESRVCCVNIGASLLQVCVWEKGEVIYTKEHAFGTNMLIQDLAAIHMIEREEAEKQLLNNTLPANWVDDTLPIFSANLQQQINRALQMYMSSFHTDRPANILLSGGGAAMIPLVDTLQQDLGINVDIFNPFSGMKINSKLDKEKLASVAPQFAIAAGLASRSFSPWHI